MMKVHLQKKLFLIENGILKKFLCKIVLNARLMNTKSTGSGRRESYKHVVSSKNEKYDDAKWKILSRGND